MIVDVTNVLAEGIFLKGVAIDLVFDRYSFKFSREERL